MTAFPEAKVILTVRDPEQWYESIKKTVCHKVQIPSPLICALLGVGNRERKASVCLLTLASYVTLKHRILDILLELTAKPIFNNSKLSPFQQKCF